MSHSSRTYFLFVIAGAIALIVEPPKIPAQSLEPSDLLAALESNFRAIGPLEFEVVFERRFPAYLKKINADRESLRLAFPDPTGSQKELLSSLLNGLNEQAVFAEQIADWQKQVKVRSCANQVLFLERCHFGLPADRNLDSTETRYLEIPSDYSPAAWGNKFQGPIKLRKWQPGMPNIDYIHERQKNTFQWIVTEESYDLDRDLLSNNFEGYPFNVTLRSAEVLPCCLFAFFADDNGTVTKLDGSSYEVVYRDSPTPVTFFFDDSAELSVRQVRQIIIDSSRGYLPVSVIDSHEYLLNGDVLTPSPTWSNVGKVWTIETAELDGCYYPSRILYEDRVVCSTGNGAPATWQSLREFVEKLTLNGSSMEVVTREFRDTHVLNVRKLPADTSPLDIECPSYASIIDQVKNTVVIPNDALEEIKLSLDYLPPQVTPGITASRFQVPLRIVICAVIVGALSAVILWSRKK